MRGLRQRKHALHFGYYWGSSLLNFLRAAVRTFPLSEPLGSFTYLQGMHVSPLHRARPTRPFSAPFQETKEYQSGGIFSKMGW